MHRREAIQLLREISKCLDGLPITCVSLKNRSKTRRLFVDDYELRIKASLDALSTKFVEHVVTKHNLRLKESDGFLVIYARTKELMEIIA